MSKEFGDDFHFVLVDVNEKRDLVKKHVQEKGISLQVILDKYGKVFKSFSGETLPLLVVIDKKGKITYYHTGYVEGDEKKLLKHLMEKKLLSRLEAEKELYDELKATDMLQEMRKRVDQYQKAL